MFLEQVRLGVKQHIVTYGTSLTEGCDWVNQIRKYFDDHFPGLVTITNSGKGSMWSGWGVENLDERVLKKNPDAVFIEFSINDAYLPYETTSAMSRHNLEVMIERITKQNSRCQIIPMVMNPPIGEHRDIRPDIEVYNQIYRDVAKERNLLLIDHYPAWTVILERDPVQFRVYVPDGIHPNSLGSVKVTTPGILAALFGTGGQGGHGPGEA